MQSSARLRSSALDRSLQKTKGDVIFLIQKEGEMRTEQLNSVYFRPI